MNYIEMDLSKNEKINYLLKGIILSFVVSYLFYDNLWVGVFISFLYSLTIKDYRKEYQLKKEQEILSQFRDMLYSISSSLVTGRTMAQSLKESITFWSSTYEDKDFIMVELNRMVNEIEQANEDDTKVIMDFANRTGLEDINNFALTYINAKETGCDLTSAINRASDIISDKIAIEKDLKITLKEKELESKIVTLAPFVILLFLRLTSNSYLGTFLETTKGHIIATISLLLIYISSVISKRIVKIEI